MTKQLILYDLRQIQLAGEQLAKDGDWDAYHNTLTLIYEPESVIF